MPAVNGSDELRAIELLHAATNQDREAQGSPTQRAASLSPVAHGYSAIASQATRAIADHQRQEQGAAREDDIHPDLRSRPGLMPAASNIAPAANMLPTQIPPPSNPKGDASSPGPDAVNSAIASQMSNDDGSAKGKGKRELSQSKRAAQNRAAQRAFRRRKEEYIKKLEEKVADAQRKDESWDGLCSNYENLFTEYGKAWSVIDQYRDVIVGAIHAGKIEPPAGVDLQATPFAAPPLTRILGAEPRDQSIPAHEPLAAIAQAVMTPTGQGPTPMTEDDRTDEEINRQLRTDGLP